MDRLHKRNARQGASQVGIRAFPQPVAHLNRTAPGATLLRDDLIGVLEAGKKNSGDGWGNLRAISAINASGIMP
jgi:hypothetical protein